MSSTYHDFIIPFESLGSIVAAIAAATEAIVVEGMDTKVWVVIIKAARA